MSAGERGLLQAVVRSSLILTMIVAIPLGAVTGLLGPVIGLAAFAAAIPLSAHLGGAARLGAGGADALMRIRSEPARIGKAVALAALLGLNVLFLIPTGVAEIPFLSLAIMSHFSVALYVLGLYSREDRFGPDLAVPVVLVCLLSVYLM